MAYQTRKNKKHQMGFYDYSPQEVKDSLGTTEAKISLIGGVSGFDDQISVDVTPEESTTFISKVDQDGNRRPETERTFEEVREEELYQISSNFADIGYELGIDPVETALHYEYLEEKTGLMNPILPLMYSRDIETIEVAKIAMRNQNSHHYLDYKMTPKQKAILNNEPSHLGPGVDWRTTGQKAIETAAYMNRWQANPVELAQMAYEKMRNLEIGKLFTLNDGLTRLKNKNGEQILVGEPQDNSTGGY